MTGITRIEITDNISGRGAYRFKESKERWPMVNNLYQYIAAARGLSLLPGYEIIQCTKNEAAAIYDLELGIDVILGFDNGMQMTLQEKILFTSYKTVTVEYMNDPKSGEEGDWFSLRSNWYSVCYDTDKNFEIDDWILLDWPATKLLTASGVIGWDERVNLRDGAKATFKYALMDLFPRECVVAYSDWPEFSSYPRKEGDTGQLPLI